MSQHAIINRRKLCDTAYILRFERNGLNFSPGQHINIGLNGDDSRPYSIYSGINDDFIEVLIKEVINGNVSRKLKFVEPGEYIRVDQPCGSFTVETELLEKVPIFLIASGTGISPYHCFIQSYPQMDYQIIHGVRFVHESYERETYDTGKYICCTSQDAKGDYTGRVTEYIKDRDLMKHAHYFLCGNYAMIDDVYDLLTAQGVAKGQVKTEGYF